MKIYTLFICLFLVSCITAYSAGEEFPVEFSDTVKDCYIEQNTSSLEGLTFEEINNSVVIKTEVGFKEDSFVVSCLVNSYREETQVRGSGSRGRSRVNVIVRPALRDYSQEIADYYERINQTEEQNNETIVVILPEQKKSWWQRFIDWIIFWN